MNRPGRRIGRGKDPKHSEGRNSGMKSAAGLLCTAAGGGGAFLPAGAAAILLEKHRRRIACLFPCACTELAVPENAGPCRLSAAETDSGEN